MEIQKRFDENRLRGLQHLILKNPSTSPITLEQLAEKVKLNEKKKNSEYYHKWRKEKGEDAVKKI